MRRKKAEQKSGNATLLAVKKEMAKPRMAQSAREREKRTPDAALIVPVTPLILRDVEIRQCETKSGSRRFKTAEK
jgi:hypothetical protein